ncbi:MAG: hypothetical protein U9N49_02575 [Campylobacterota bacterium]|nr:hypothetical protein [Campylobacterota bacterium]
MHRVFLMAVFIFFLTSCGETNRLDSSNEVYNPSEEILNVDAIWIDQIPSEFTNPIYTKATYLKIPSILYWHESLEIEIYGAWYRGDKNNEFVDGCNTQYSGYEVYQSEEFRLEIELRKIELSNSSCTIDKSLVNVTLKDTIRIDNLMIGEYQIVVKNPNGEDLIATLVVE